jgi:DNA-binding NarL/FixJ family response regulator
LEAAICAACPHPAPSLNSTTNWFYWLYATELDGLSLSSSPTKSRYAFALQALKKPLQSTELLSVKTTSTDPGQQKYDALIIDPDPASRMRLKQATANCADFRQVKLANSLYNALQDLKERVSCNIIYISQAFEPGHSAEFVRQARETKTGQYCAYIMIVDGRRQTRTAISSNISQGMDGFLFQPFSVDALRETTQIAAKVRGKSSAQRNGASKHLLLDSIVPSIERLNDLFLEGKKLDFVKADLKALTRALSDSCSENPESYYQALINLFENVEAPELPDEDDLSVAAMKRRRKIEAEIAERVAAESEAAAAAAQEQQKGPGGYFEPKRRR